MKSEQLMLDLDFVDSSFEIAVECFRKSIENSPDKENIVRRLLVEIDRYKHLLNMKDLTRLSKIYL